MLTIKYKVLKTKCIKLWNRRTLALIVSIAVVNCILLPPLTNLFSTLATLKSQILNTINNMFYDFVWQCQSRIQSKVLIRYDSGDLKMVDVFVLLKS